MADDPRRPPSSRPKLHVHMDEHLAAGHYANLVLINHSEHEFVLDFAFLRPNDGRANVAARIISSPKHTKRLLVALRKNLERYEASFGPIEIGDADDAPMIH